MKFTVTIVATIDAKSYGEATDATDFRLVTPMRKYDNEYVQPLTPARIDVRLEGESE